MRLTRSHLLRAGALLGLVGLEFYLAHSMTSTPSIRGYVETRAFAVSSTQKGLVRKLDVTLGVHVSAGQVIAELDPGAVDAEIATLTSERHALIAKARTGVRDDAALHAVDEKLEALADRRDSTRLRAPADGVIESISVQPGDAVAANATVATIVTSDTHHVVACVPEQRIGEVAVGSSASITSVVGHVRMNGVVESLTPAIAELPPRCQPVVAKPPQYGRLAIVALEGSTASLPGESELIAFGPRVGAKPPIDSSVVPVTQPQPIDVPASLAALSRIEASGIVWMPSLERYIVISDETGQRDRHAPWLFSMSKRGVLDPEPIVISELSALDDVESIAADDHDGLWVLASQSTSAGGKRPGARELLAHLIPEGIGYRADRTVKLASLLAGQPDIDFDALNIEGMAYRGGALYFGLKAPTQNSRAVIWKVANPDRLLAGDLAGAGFSTWGSVPLQVKSNGVPTVGGIADMMFVSDTQLVVASTPSNPGLQQQDGALYLVTMTATGLTAKPLESFANLKPEGVALTPSGRLAIVFDTGHDLPLWTEIDLPQSI